MATDSFTVTYGDGWQQTMEVEVTASQSHPPQTKFQAHTIQVGNTHNEQTVITITPQVPVGPPPPPPPPSGGPNISAAVLSQIGVTVGARLDSGDSVMLNPSHWAISSAHSQANGSATKNTSALAKYGQSYYGGATDSYLHCSVANGEGLWMVGDKLPSTGKWICEFSVKLGGSSDTKAYGWGSGWVVGSSGQELDVFEVVGWSANPCGYGSSTYRSKAGTVVNSYYNESFPLADGNFHTYTLVWDMENALQYLIWDGVLQPIGENKATHIAIANPSEQMALQISTGYTAGNSNVPSSWSAAADSVYQYIRYWAAS